jgi:hypothetical protein
MADERRVMYDGFSDTDKHSVEMDSDHKRFLKVSFCLWSS